MMETLSPLETLVLTRATWRNIPEDAIRHSHRHENLKCCDCVYKTHKQLTLDLMFLETWVLVNVHYDSESLNKIWWNVSREDVGGLTHILCSTHWSVIEACRTNDDVMGPRTTRTYVGQFVFDYGTIASVQIFPVHHWIITPLKVTQCAARISPRSASKWRQILRSGFHTSM
jgi:hypothetical protein